MRLTRPLLIALLMLSVVATATTAAVFSWRNGTTSHTAESVLGGRIQAEHLRVCGRSLAYDSRLTWLARYRATEMALERWFSHTNPYTGLHVWTLMDRVGIGRISGAEILAWNTVSDSTSPDYAYGQFMGSTSHRAAIRQCHYRTFGVGDFKAGAKHMFAVLFVQPS